MKDIFISYSTADKEFVDILVDLLNREGISIWIDEGEILPGDRIREKINQGILDSRYLLIVLSQNSIRSNWVRVELDSAMIREIEDSAVTVIPVLIGDIKLAQIPLDLRGKLYIDFRDSEMYSKSAQRLVSSIKRRIDDQYQYEIIYGRNEIDILTDDGSKVRYIKNKLFKVLDHELKYLKEEYYSDGRVEVVNVEPGNVVSQVRTLNNLVLTVDFGITLKRGQEFEQTIEAIYHDSFPNDCEYWLTNQAYPIRGAEYIFVFPIGRSYKSFNCTIKRGVQEITYDARKEEGTSDGRNYFALYFNRLNAHENVKINWEW
ncbi:MAG: toll/interleukin-1 receptor domain-containing protein [Syntrophobacteraceae bacterium]|jgi:hypothetical protein